MKTICFLTPGHSIVYMPGSYPIDQCDGNYERLVPIIVDNTGYLIEMVDANTIYSDDRLIDPRFNSN